LHGLVQARAITSSALNRKGAVEATAAVLAASLPVLQSATGATPTAQVLRAVCAGTNGGVVGHSDVVGLNLGRLGTVPVSGRPNQAIDLPQVLRVVVNEQVRGADGSLTVTALHIRLLGGGVTGQLGSGDIRLASATCGRGTKSVPPATTRPPTVRPTTPPGPRTSGQVSVVPAGAPQTGDGTRAAR
jgi:hypothetical protein